MGVRLSSTLAERRSLNVESILKKYMEITKEVGETFIDTLKSQNKVMTYDLMKICSDYTLNIICEAAMGIKLDSMEAESVRKYKSAIHDMGNIVCYRIPREYVTNWTMTFFYNLNKLQKKTINTLKIFSKNIIEERVEYHKRNEDKFLNEFLEQKEKNFVYHENIEQKRRLAMLDLLLAVKKDGLIDDRGIQEEVDTFTFEGHDTTAMALFYTMILLAENKDAQELARIEVTAVLSENDGKIDDKIDVMNKLNYLERCIKESLRLYPPVSTVLRYAAEDVQLKHAFIPAGTHLILHLFDTHRDPNFWSDPEKFDPDRFLPENCKNRHPYSYVPFAAGYRNCIGQKFAMMEIKCLLAQLLYDFYLEPVEMLRDMKLKADIVLRPNKPVHLKFIKIDK